MADLSATAPDTAAQQAALPAQIGRDEPVKPVSLRWLWQWVRPHKGALALALITLSLQVGIEAVLPLVVGRGIIDHILLESGDLHLLTLFAVGAIGLMVIKGLLVFAQIYLMNYVGQRAVADLRRAVFDHLLSLPLSFFNRRRSGELISRMTSDVGVIQQTVVNSIADGVQHTLLLGGIIVFIFYLHWQLALVSLVTLPLAALAIDRFGGRIRVSSGRLQGRIADMTSLLAEALSGMRVVKAFTMEQMSRDRFAQENERSFRASMKSAQAMATVYPLVEIIQVVGMAIVLWFGGREVLRGNLTLGELISFLTYLGMAARPVSTLTKTYGFLQQAMAAAGRLQDLLMVPPEPQPSPNSVRLPRVKGHITLENVRFGYDADRLVLKGVNLTVRPGEVVALVGPSGAGKTTLVNLLPRFYDPVSGSVKVDGYDVRDVDIASLRDQIGLVPQETVLFAGTLAENIAAGRNVTYEQIVEAAKLAHADEFIRRLPNGYDTVVGERGVTLSGGQCQRIAIARAIVGDPPILIMDEATSALDTESERLIRDAMTRIRQGRTTLIIAHRASTVRMADRIVVMVDGQIAQDGTHEELIGVPGVYQRLYAEQLVMDEAAATAEDKAGDGLAAADGQKLAGQEPERQAQGGQAQAPGDAPGETSGGGEPVWA